MSAPGMSRAALAASVLMACSAPALQADLAEAESRERAGDHDAALAAYTRAQTSCPAIDDLRRRYATCREAYLGRAELLDRMGQRRQAAEDYRRIPEILPDHRSASAEALYRAGRIYLEIGEDETGYTLLWRAITHYPDEEFAADALKKIVHDGRRRNPVQLYRELGKLAGALQGTQIADNLLYYMAPIAEKLGDAERALQLYDQIAERHPDDGLIDDALWHGARLARVMGDGRGAVSRLRKLAATREVAFGTGSYLSVWHDDGQLELGRVLRDELGEHRASATELRRLHELYPASILHDDALYEEALSWQRAGEPSRACQVLAELSREHPGSKYELSKAPALRDELRCQGAAEAHRAAQ